MVNPDAVKFWGEMWKLYYGNICCCDIADMDFIFDRDLRIKKATMSCKLCGLRIAAKLKQIETA